jgi:uncharacterized protein
MKILVMSDTHGDIKKAEEAIRKNKDVNLVVHLGDYFRDAMKLAEIFPDIPVEYIYGNSDFMIEDVPAEKLLEISGRKIFITHGHRYSVKWDYEKLHRKAKDMHVDLLLFGHTHVADIVKNGRYSLVNPGSISDPRGGDYNETYAIIDIEDEVIESRLCHV